MHLVPIGTTSLLPSAQADGFELGRDRRRVVWSLMERKLIEPHLDSHKRRPVAGAGRKDVAPSGAWVEWLGRHRRLAPTALGMSPLPGLRVARTNLSEAGPLDEPIAQAHRAGTALAGADQAPDFGWRRASGEWDGNQWRLSSSSRNQSSLYRRPGTLDVLWKLGMSQSRNCTVPPHRLSVGRCNVWECSFEYVTNLVGYGIKEATNAAMSSSDLPISARHSNQECSLFTRR